MKKAVVLFLGICISFGLAAQETVVWGSKVVDLSSEFGPYEYSGIQVLHKPNVLPAGGDSPNAWRPKSEDKEEFIMVSFDTPIRAKQVAIAESENPGAVKKILAYDTEYREYDLFPELTPRAIPIESRLLNLFFEETPYEITAIKVIIDGAAVPGFNAIDAIGISRSNIPIAVLINLAKNINQEVPTEKLSANVNSTAIEHSPILSPDGKRLYFSRQYHPENVGGADDPEDIWVSELDEATGEWKPAKNAGPPLNNAGPNFISSISVIDGQEVVILGNEYGKKDRMFTGVSMSIRNGDSFSTPTSLKVDNNYNYSQNSDFYLVPGGKALLMSAERDDSYGSRDLYVSFKKQDGSWTEPLNLGGDINTVGEEESPFIAENGTTLYFSTNGLSGYGGKDIYVSLRLDDTWTKWTEPENLGAGINGKGDDEYFSIPSNGSNAYFTRGDQGEDMDVFSFKVDDLFVQRSGPVYESMKHLVSVLITVKGKVTNSKTGDPMPNAKVVVERLPDGVDVGETMTDASGSYSIVLRPGARYGLVPLADGYLSQNANLDLNSVKESAEMTRDLLLAPIEVGAKVVINNIFFATNKSDLQTASFPELERVADLMSQNKISKILIIGHTDSVGEDAYNLSLSQRRARAVYTYFLTKGIAKERLKFEGKGETEPAVPNDTPENRQLNRRVEFKIIE
jgi:outer membrane protein OmpA-like peptidoglycan-associated protein